MLLTGAVAACGGDDDDTVSEAGGAGPGGAGGQATAGSSGQQGGGKGGVAGSSGSSGQTSAGSAGQTTGGQAGSASGASGGAGSGGAGGPAGAAGEGGQGAGAAGTGGSGGSGQAGKGGSGGTAGSAGGGTTDTCAPLFGDGAMLGATIDGSTKIATASVDQFKALGVKSVRVYVSIKWGANATQNESAINAVKLLHSAGLHVVMAVVGSDGAEPTDAQQTRDTFKVLIEGKGLKDVVDIWELGNEPDHTTYWKSGNIGTYSTKYLLPAAKLLHTYKKGGKALQVANAPPSYSIDQLKQMLATVDPEDTSAACKKDKSKCTTARDQVDYVNLHFYHDDLTNPKPGDKYPQDLRTYLGLLNEVAAGKPTMSTEWSMNKPSSGGTQAWADLIKHAWQDDCLIRDSLAIAHYYTWTADLSQPHGADGVFVVDTSGTQATLTPNEPFHTMFSQLE